jgi:hypothetical protein
MRKFKIFQTLSECRPIWSINVVKVLFRSDKYWRRETSKLVFPGHFRFLEVILRHYPNRSILHDNGNISQNMISFYKLELFIEWKMKFRDISFKSEYFTDFLNVFYFWTSLLYAILGSEYLHCYIDSDKNFLTRSKKYAFACYWSNNILGQLRIEFLTNFFVTPIWPE